MVAIAEKLKSSCNNQKDFPDKDLLKNTKKELCKLLQQSALRPETPFTPAAAHVTPMVHSVTPGHVRSACSRYVTPGSARSTIRRSKPGSAYFLRCVSATVRRGDPEQDAELMDVSEAQHTTYAAENTHSYPQHVTHTAQHADPSHPPPHPWAAQDASYRSHPVLASHHSVPRTDTGVCRHSVEQHGGDYQFAQMGHRDTGSVGFDPQDCEPDFDESTSEVVSSINAKMLFDLNDQTARKSRSRPYTCVVETRPHHSAAAQADSYRRQAQDLGRNSSVFAEDSRDCSLLKLEAKHKGGRYVLTGGSGGGDGPLTAEPYREHEQRDIIDYLDCDSNSSNTHVSYSDGVHLREHREHYHNRLSQGDFLRAESTHRALTSSLSPSILANLVPFRGGTRVHNNFSGFPPVRDHVTTRDLRSCDVTARVSMPRDLRGLRDDSSQASSRSIDWEDVAPQSPQFFPCRL